jgi:hypothetical protein
VPAARLRAAEGSLTRADAGFGRAGGERSAVTSVAALAEVSMRMQMAARAVLAVAALAAPPLAVAQDLAARVKQAEAAAKTNESTPRGREWKKTHLHAIDRLMILYLNRCLPDPPGDIPTVFSVFVRLGRDGKAREMVTELDEAVGRCMTGAAKDGPFPEPPADDYWVQVNMAAPL